MATVTEILREDPREYKISNRRFGAKLSILSIVMFDKCENGLYGKNAGMSELL